MCIISDIFLLFFRISSIKIVYASIIVVTQARLLNYHVCVRNKNVSALCGAQNWGNRWNTSFRQAARIGDLCQIITIGHVKGVCHVVVGCGNSNIHRLMLVEPPVSGYGASRVELCRIEHTCMTFKFSRLWLFSGEVPRETNFVGLCPSSCHWIEQKSHGNMIGVFGMCRFCSK